ncbi:MAG: hypothetical protein H6586_01555 [Flavobacteriales bacterium]|nr:hypothetical protein [Flavobacteriales bacterium]
MTTTIKKIFVLSLVLTTIMSSCSKDEDSTPDSTVSVVSNPTGGTGGTIPTSDYYFRINVDGTEVLFQSGINNYASAAGESGGSATAGYREEQSSQLQQVFSSTNIGGYTVVKVLATQPTQCSDLSSIFNIGVQPFGSTINETNGVVVFYVDGSGVYWSTDLGVGTQTGSNFEITELSTNSGIESEKITKAIFNCTLYDGNGNSKTVTNGLIRSFSLQCGGL